MTGLVNLASGGLDSTLISVLACEEGWRVHPLFLDYGQRAAPQEWRSCVEVHERMGLGHPKRMDLSGFGRIIISGLTDPARDLVGEAFTPCRNLLFLVAAGAYAAQVGASAIALGLLSEADALFPDQRAGFISAAQSAVSEALGRRLSVITPLFGFSKAEVVALAGDRGIVGTYSCHAGTEMPCGVCISCVERARSC